MARPQNRLGPIRDICHTPFAPDTQSPGCQTLSANQNPNPVSIKPPFQTLSYLPTTKRHNFPHIAHDGATKTAFHSTNPQIPSMQHPMFQQEDLEMGVENSRPKSTDLDNYRAVPAPVSCPICRFTSDLIPTPPATPPAEPLESKCFAEISHLTKPPTISSSPTSSSEPEDELLRNGEPATSIELKSFTATLSPTPPSLSPPTSSPASEILSFDSLLRTYSSYPHPEKGNMRALYTTGCLDTDKMSDLALLYPNNGGLYRASHS